LRQEKKIQLQDRRIDIMDIIRFRQWGLQKSHKSDYDPITCVMSQIRYADLPLRTRIQSV